MKGCVERKPLEDIFVIGILTRRHHFMRMTNVYLAFTINSLVAVFRLRCRPGRDSMRRPRLSLHLRQPRRREGPRVRPRQNRTHER